jgi:hypothetical protein
MLINVIFIRCVFDLSKSIFFDYDKFLRIKIMIDRMVRFNLFLKQ